MLELQTGWARRDRRQLTLRGQRVICWPQVSFFQPTCSLSRHSIQIFPAWRKSVTPRSPASPREGVSIFVGKSVPSRSVPPSLHRPPGELCCRLLPFLEWALDSQPGQRQCCRDSFWNLRLVLHVAGFLSPSGFSLERKSPFIKINHSPLPKLSFYYLNLLILLFTCSLSLHLTQTADSIKAGSVFCSSVYPFTVSDAHVCLERWPPPSVLPLLPGIFSNSYLSDKSHVYFILKKTTY